MLSLIGCAVLLFGGAKNITQGQWTEPVPMEPNFGTGMRAVWISNDGLRLYLSAGIDAVGWTERDSIGGEWNQWTALPPQVNSSNTQTSMCESPSGDTLYFTSNSDERPDGGFGWMDIYYCVQTDTGWGPAVNAGPNVNGEGREWSVNISRDGSMLLIAGQIPEDGSHSLYYSMLQEDRAWGPKVSFGPNVNTWMDEEHPSLSPDNRSLYYNNGGQNHGDIWVSELVDSVWTVGVPLPSPVNSLETEMNPCIAVDGRTLWYRKGRAESGFRIVTTIDTTAMAIGGTRPPVGTGRGMRVLHSSSSGIMFELFGPYVFNTYPVQIHNILGQAVLSTTVNVTSTERRAFLTLPPLPSGTYLISVQLPENQASAKFDIIH